MLIISIFATQAHTVEVTQKLTQQDITRTVNNIITVLDTNYIFPEKTKLLISALQQKVTSSEFNRPIKFTEFIKQTGLLMRSISGDGYIDIIAENSSLVIGHSLSAQEQTKDNFGFDKVEILSGNIGYVKLNHFYENPNAKLAAAKAFDHLKETNAMIIDLRDAEGDSLSLVQFMMSFFVADKSKLGDILYDRQTQKVGLWSSENISNSHFNSNFPLYILTSAFIAGSGEFFTYTLKHLDKAVVVGEKTMGVAYISKKLRVNEFISINLPIAIPIHPVTNSNWEQEGVVPDYDTKANASFELAYNLAKTYLRSTNGYKNNTQ